MTEHTNGTINPIDPERTHLFRALTDRLNGNLRTDHSNAFAKDHKRAEVRVFSTRRQSQRRTSRFPSRFANGGQISSFNLASESPSNQVELGCKLGTLAGSIQDAERGASVIERELEKDDFNGDGFLHGPFWIKR